MFIDGLPQWLSGKKSACTAGDAGDTRSIPRWKILWRRKWQLTAIFLLGAFNGQKSLQYNSPHRVVKSQK